MIVKTICVNKSQTVREELSEFLLTQSFLLLALMGMFEDEKVVSR